MPVPPPVSDMVVTEAVSSLVSEVVDEAVAAGAHPPAAVQGPQKAPPSQVADVAGYEGSRPNSRGDVGAMRAMHRYATFFADADIEFDRSLSFAEFVSVLPMHLRQQRPLSELWSWFKMIDANNDGRVSLDEFFWCVRHSGPRFFLPQCASPPPGQITEKLAQLSLASTGGR